MSNNIVVCALYKFAIESDSFVFNIQSVTPHICLFQGSVTCWL